MSHDLDGAEVVAMKALQALVDALKEGQLLEHDLRLYA